jgi:protein TonB
MRMASYFILSLALHAAALAYPVSFIAHNQDTAIIQVTITAMEEARDGGAPAGSEKAPNRKSASQGSSKSPHAMALSAPPAVQTRPDEFPEPTAVPADLAAAQSEAADAAASTTMSSVASCTAASTVNGTGTCGFAGTVEIEASATGWSLPGLGSDFLGALAFGNGAGSGSRQNSSAVTRLTTQARYRDTPRPEYPESARRAGREGRVLLRVLVDEQGRSKHVEINSSSGSDALDRAAAEAIRRWRFHPAQQGDQPVESWLRIPIEFYLADAKHP